MLQIHKAEKHISFFVLRETIVRALGIPVNLTIIGYKVYYYKIFPSFEYF